MRLVLNFPEVIIVPGGIETIHNKTAAFQMVCFNPWINLIVTS